MANLPLRLAVRVHCGHHVRRGSLGVRKRPLRAAHGVLLAYSRGIPPPVSHGTARSEECAAFGRARLPPFSCRLERACANELIYLLQGLELLVTVLLARNRRPPPTVAAGAPHAELAAELITLPSGLLAMVCEAIVNLKVRLGAALRVRLGCMGVCWEYCV